MTLETKATLHDSTIQKLQDLIRINIDSHEGLLAVADKTDNDAVAELFRQISRDRRVQAAELQALVADNCQEPVEAGSFVAAAHRAVIDIRAALGQGTKVMLNEAEKGEDSIKEAYEAALRDEPGTAVSDVLHSHYAAVKTAHDRVRDLRDGFPEAC